MDYLSEFLCSNLILQKKKKTPELVLQNCKFLSFFLNLHANFLVFSLFTEKLITLSKFLIFDDFKMIIN